MGRDKLIRHSVPLNCCEALQKKNQIQSHTIASNLARQRNINLKTIHDNMEIDTDCHMGTGRLVDKSNA